MKKRQKVYLSLLGGFLAFILLCTYISAQIEAHRRVLVTTTEAAAGTLKSGYAVQGQLTYDHSEAVSVPVGCTIAEIHVEDNEYVNEGRLLATVDTEALTDWRLQQKIQLNKAKEQLPYLSGDEKEYAQRQIDRVETQLAQTQAILENEGEITAPCGGLVRLSGSKADTPLAKETVLCELCNISDSYTITFLSDRTFAVGDAVLLTVVT